MGSPPDRVTRCAPRALRRAPLAGAPRRAIRWPAVLFGAALALLPACNGCRGKGGEAAAVPASVHIPVVIDGAEAAPIDAPLLDRIRPDFTEGERRAWRLRSLLGAIADRPHNVVEVEDETGGRSVMIGAGAPQGREAVLAVNRSGEVRAAMIKPDEPFPSFHGRAENRSREGGSGAGVREVRKIWIHLEGAGEAAGKRGDADGGAVASSFEIALKVEIEGRPPVTWTRSDLDKSPHLAASVEQEDNERVAWSLRSVAEQLVGPGAVVTEVLGGGGKSVKIDAASFRDTAKVPVLRANRRGFLKFLWLDSKLQPLEADKVREVSELRVKPGG